MSTEERVMNTQRPTIDRRMLLKILSVSGATLALAGCTFPIQPQLV